MSQFEEPETRRGWTSEPDGRGTMQILWACILTMFLCSWSILCLNVPGTCESKRLVLRRKIAMTMTSILCPEVPFGIALSQWLHARQAVRDIRSLECSDDPEAMKRFQPYHPGRSVQRESPTKRQQWTIREAFFAEMGGFRLQSLDYPPFPIDAEQILYLVSRGYMELPSVDCRYIEDKNKADGLLRSLTLCQTLWFLVSMVGRWVQGLVTTGLELTTVSFALCSCMTAFVWWYKPADVFVPEVLKNDIKIDDILQAERVKLDGWTHTPLDFINHREWFGSIACSNYVHVLTSLGVKLGSDVTPIDRIPDTWSKEVSRGQQWLCVALCMVFLSVFFVAWRHDFPSEVEKILWRIAACTMTISPLLVLLLAEIDRYWPGFTKPSSNDPSPEKVVTEPSRSDPDREESPPSERGPGRLSRVLDNMRNNSPRQDAALSMSLKAMIPLYIAALAYIVARIYIMIADFVELRSLPLSAYDTVEWQEFWPHFG